MIDFNIVLPLKDANDNLRSNESEKLDQLEAETEIAEFVSVNNYEVGLSAILMFMSV